jgi:hypothetical protein
MRKVKIYMTSRPISINFIFIDKYDAFWQCCIVTNSNFKHVRQDILITKMENQIIGKKDATASLTVNTIRFDLSRNTTIFH